MTWQEYKKNCTTEELINIAREAGFVIHYDSLHKLYTVSGNGDDLRRFFMKTAGEVLLQNLHDEQQRLGLYD